MSHTLAAPAALAPVTLPAGAVRLSDWGLIRARGEDATVFLQGQLTNDLAHAAAGEARLAGYCSAKGRMLGSFIAWRAAPDEWLLACSAELLPQLLKRLSMFVLRSRCKLSDASAELGLWGVAGAGVQTLLPAWPEAAWRLAALPDGGQLVRLPDAAGLPRALLVAPREAALPASLPGLSPEGWAWLEVASGVARIVTATVEAFVPQMVNFELAGGVSFQKGCYPGQEVVARSQYRGTLKRRGFLLAADAPLRPGQEVFSADDPAQPAGTVALAASWPQLPAQPNLALVELKRAAAGSALHLGAPDGPALRVVALPYVVPADEA